MASVAQAAAENAYFGLTDVHDVLLIPLLGGGYTSRSLLRDGVYYHKKLDAARNPALFGNATDDDVRKAEVDHALQQGLLMDMRRDMQLGSCSNGLRIPLTSVGAIVKELVDWYPVLVRIFYHKATVEEVLGFTDAMRTRNGFRWEAGQGGNYVLCFYDPRITITRLLPAMEATPVGRRPLGAACLMDYYAQQVAAGNGDACPFEINSGESMDPAGQRPFHHLDNSGNPLPGWQAGVRNSLEPGSVSGDKSVYVAVACT